jgi:hypothetical protein
MMARHSIARTTAVVSIFGAAGPALDEVSLLAWIAQAAPGETLVYHRGFLALDATSIISKLPAEHQRALRLMASAALRAAEQGLVHLVQARIGPDQFAYIAIARARPRQTGPALSTRLLAAA